MDFDRIKAEPEQNGSELDWWLEDCSKKTDEDIEREIDELKLGLELLYDSYGVHNEDTFWRETDIVCIEHDIFMLNRILDMRRSQVKEDTQSPPSNLST